MTAAGGFLGGLIGRRLPPTPRTVQGMLPPLIGPPPISTGIGLMDTMTGGLLGTGASMADSSSLPQPSTPTTMGQMISPTSMLPRGISSYSLASLGGAVTPTPVMTKKQILRQIDDTIINFPSVSQSPTIPNQANRSPNSINFPKVNASPTHHIQAPVRKNSGKSRSKKASLAKNVSGEGAHLLDADTAMVVDTDDMDDMGLMGEDCLPVDSAITNTTSTTSTANQWSSAVHHPQVQVTGSGQATIISSGYPTQQPPSIPPRELPNVPLSMRPGGQSLPGVFNPPPNPYLMPENQSIASAPQMQMPMNLQNPNYLSQRMLPSTAAYKQGRPMAPDDPLNQWC